MGNALRRVLLSSIPGAAITSIKIDGVLHEFSTIPGVKEDTTELILNLREVFVKAEPPTAPSGDGDDADKDQNQPLVLRIDKKGPGAVTGAVSYTHLRAHETVLDVVCRLLLGKKK